MNWSGSESGEMKQYFVLGSYTEPILFGTGELFQGKGRGISICSFEGGVIEVISEIALKNPSFLCIDEPRRKIYSVNELKEYLGKWGGGLTQLSYGEDLSIVEEGTWNVGGTDPCHIELSPNGRFVAIANFANGSVTSFSVDGSGAVVDGSRSIIAHEGQSLHPIRQRGPHAHSCVFSKDGKLMLVPDLGIDRVVMYTYEGDRLTPAAELDIVVPPGSGPRYGEFSKDGTRFYLINEISSQVMVFSYEEGDFSLLQTVHTLPDDFTGDNICSDLHVTGDGTMLYASNRGHDSIVSYRVVENGLLAFVDRQGCGGKTPRNFAIDPTDSFVLVGNQDSDDITIFAITETGALHLVNQFHTGSPVCIRFLHTT